MIESTRNPIDDSPDFYARAAGLGYLIIIVTGIFAEFVVRSSLIVPGDATATAGNLMASQSLFRMGLASEFVMLVSDVFVALALYVVFKEASRSLALLAAFFRLAHASIVGINLLATYVPLLLLGQAEYLTVFADGQRHALALLALEAHSYGYVIGLVFFGVHCLLLGWLVLTSRSVPGLLGGLLILAGAGYLIDGFGQTLFPGYAEQAATLQMIVLLPAFIGEVSFGLWLLVKGVEVPRLRPLPTPGAVAP